MVTKQTTVVNEFGIHCRPSGVIARETADCTSTLCVTNPDGATADPRQVLALMSLGITCGTTVTVTAEGPDEEQDCEFLAALFKRNFDFER